MPTRALLDSNVFIFGFERRASNSHRILEALADGSVHGVVTDRIVRETMRYLRRHYGKDLSGKFRDFLVLTCELVLESDLEIRADWLEAVGAKDAGALAAARSQGLRFLVTTDRDFEDVPERRTPRAFLREIGVRLRAGEE